MGSHPNMVMVASVKVPEKELESFLNEDGDFVGLTEFYCVGNEDTGIPVDRGCIGIFDYVTYGWGEGITPTELEAKLVKFTKDITPLFEEKGYPFTIKFGANWF